MSEQVDQGRSSIQKDQKPEPAKPEPKERRHSDSPDLLTPDEGKEEIQKIGLFLIGKDAFSNFVQARPRAKERLEK
jgi:hypothetical protein